MGLSQKHAQVPGTCVQLVIFTIEKEVPGTFWDSSLIPQMIRWIIDRGIYGHDK